MNAQTFTRWFTMTSRTCVATLVACGCTSLSLAEIPEPLEGIVFGDEKREVQRLDIDGVEFEYLNTHSDMPFLMWPSEGRRVPKMSHDQTVVTNWLMRVSDELGFTGFEPRYVDSFRWHDNNVWTYELVRNDLTLQDARIMVHWNEREFLGLVNQVPNRIVSIQDPAPDMEGDELVYFASRTKVGEYQVIPAQVIRDRKRDRTIVTTKAIDGSNEITEFPDPPVLFRANIHGVFTEWNLPLGSFPDQISVDEDGIVWLSQPNDNRFTSFDPETEQFTQNLVTGGSGPDGLIVGTRGKVWSGMYYSASLGVWDIDTGTYSNYPAPYGGAYPAIPVETTNGSIWVTDHLANRISEFDPINEVWIQTLTMPTAACWVVQGHEDYERGEVYFTEFNSDQLGRLRLSDSSLVDIVVPGGGPAFCAYANGKVYYSRWNESGIGAYDVETGAVVEYDFPVANEWGGPLWLTPGGDIVCGTRNRGYIMVFHVATQSFTSYEIPTSFAGLKDGLTVGADGVIWFTETNRNKLARLELSQSPK